MNNTTQNSMPHYSSVQSLPMLLRVEDLMPLLSVGRNTAYSLVRSGQIQSIRVGRQIRVPRDALLRFMSTT